jgi:hypothetical protein
MVNSIGAPIRQRAKPDSKWRYQVALVPCAVMPVAMHSMRALTLLPQPPQITLLSSAPDIHRLQ